MTQAIGSDLAELEAQTTQIFENNQTSLQDLIDRISAIEGSTEVSDLDTRVSALESSVTQLNLLPTRVDDLETGLTSLGDAVTSFTQDVQSTFVTTGQNISTLQADVGQLQNQLNTISTDIIALQEFDSAALTTRVTTLEADTVQLRDEMDSVLPTLDTAVSSISALQTGHDNQASLITALQTDMDSVESSITTLTNSQNTQDTNISSLQTYTTNLGISLDSTIVRVDELEDDNIKKADVTELFSGLKTLMRYGNGVVYVSRVYSQFAQPFNTLSSISAANQWVAWPNLSLTAMAGNMLHIRYNATQDSSIAPTSLYNHSTTNDIQLRINMDQFRNKLNNPAVFKAIGLYDDYQNFIATVDNKFYYRVSGDYHIEVRSDNNSALLQNSFAYGTSELTISSGHSGGNCLTRSSLAIAAGQTMSHTCGFEVPWMALNTTTYLQPRIYSTNADLKIFELSYIRMNIEIRCIDGIL